jgi:hypothetical protein
MVQLGLTSRKVQHGKLTVLRAGVVGLYAATDDQAEDATGATGVAVVLQELVVAAQTGYESVHGQSEMVL